MNDNLFKISNNEDYELWTTTEDNGKSFGRIELEFKRPVSIVLGEKEEVNFHHCKHISSDKVRANLSFYNKDMQEIVGSTMNIVIMYITEGGVKKDLDLRCFRHKETLKSFCEGEFGGTDLSESEWMDFCMYYDIEFFDTLESMKSELQTRQALSSYDMDFIDVDALAEDLHFTKINDSLWIDISGFSIFQETLYHEFCGDIFVAIDNWRN